jgi:hypothetical protein
MSKGGRAVPSSRRMGTEDTVRSPPRLGRIQHPFDDVTPIAAAMGLVPPSCRLPRFSPRRRPLSRHRNPMRRRQLASTQNLGRSAVGTAGAITSGSIAAAGAHSAGPRRSSARSSTTAWNTSDCESHPPETAPNCAVANTGMSTTVPRTAWLYRWLTALLGANRSRWR